jgi:membrane peptidoglycan carboxypeptidase
MANVVSLVLCGILAGVVIAAAAFPAVGVSGLTAKSASDSFSDLPADLKIPPLPQNSTLLASDGKTVLATFFDENRKNIPLTDVAPVMRQAIVAAEDNRFYEHKGVDARGIVRAFVKNQSSGEVTQGASTLTQQYIRSILKYSATTPAEKKAATEDTAGRKLREIRYAIALEKQLSKDQILQNYLNITYFGNSGYGIYAASEAYFSKEPSQLTLGEAAMIAGMAQNPTQYNPVDNTQFGIKPALDRRSYVLNQMVKMKYITQAQADAANKVNLEKDLNPKPSVQSCENGNLAYGFFCGYFQNWWDAQPAFGKTVMDREAALKKGGYRIVSSIDPRMQAAAQKVVNEEGEGFNSQYANGVVEVQPGTGRVLAMAINRKYGITKNPGWKNYPYTENPLLSGSGVSPGYQAGSTFKMFTMIAALQKGIPLSNTMNAPATVKTDFQGDTCKDGSDDYCVSNADSWMSGVHTMSSAFGESVNTYFVPLEKQVGVKNAIAVAQASGVTFRASVDQKNIKAAQTDPRAFGSFTLGTAQVTPLDMANAYATVAARGKACSTLPVNSITDQDGKQLPVANPTCKQVYSQQVADAATDAARCPPGDGSAIGISCTNSTKGAVTTAASVGRTIDRPVAGKTGTTNNDAAGWFVGFTPNLAVAAFIANPDKPNMEVPNNQTQYSTNVARDSLNASLKYLPVKNFVKPTNLLAYGIRTDVPDVAGDSVDGATSELKNAGFSVQVSSSRENSDQAEGRVARTDPTGGSSASKGSVITIYVSNGQPKGQPNQSQSPILQQLCRANPNLPTCTNNNGNGNNGGNGNN